MPNLNAKIEVQITLTYPDVASADRVRMQLLSLIAGNAGNEFLKCLTLISELDSTPVPYRAVSYVGRRQFRIHPFILRKHRMIQWLDQIEVRG